MSLEGMSIGAGVTVVSARGGRVAMLVAFGFGDLLATVLLVLYLAFPDAMGPSPDHPHADSLRDVVALFVVVWIVSALLWVLIDREVSVRDDQILITRGAGRTVILSRNDVKAVHAFSFKTWYVVWMSCKRGAPIGRSIFFSHSPDLPSLSRDAVGGGDTGTAA